MDSDASPGLHSTRCAALCTPQQRAEPSCGRTPRARIHCIRRARAGPRARRPPIFPFFRARVQMQACSRQQPTRPTAGRAGGR